MFQFFGCIIQSIGWKGRIGILTLLKTGNHQKISRLNNHLFYIQRSSASLNPSTKLYKIVCNLRKPITQHSNLWNHQKMSGICQDRHVDVVIAGLIINKFDLFVHKQLETHSPALRITVLLRHCTQ